MKKKADFYLPEDTGAVGHRRLFRFADVAVTIPRGIRFFHCPDVTQLC